jgi:AraC-like DNA-binding protein
MSVQLQGKTVHDSTMITPIDTDTIVRLIGVGQLLLLIVVVGRSDAEWRIRLIACGLFAAISAYIVNSSPALVGTSSPHRFLTQLLAQATPLLLWLFAHALFERPANRLATWGSAAVTCATFAMLVIGGPVAAAGNLAQHGLALGLVAHALWVAWTGRDDDLVESRRRFRLAFVLTVGAQAMAVLLVEMATGFAPVSPTLMLAQSSVSLLLIMALGAVLLGTNAELLAPATPPDVAVPRLSPAESVLRDRLDAAMAMGLWARPGLTVGQLAAELSIPEHRLRQLINQRLGYRNFAAWLNGHRIAEARQRLSDPALVQLPVLTIAMDLGYGSIAPFNRAFREATGLTPTEYRRQAFAPR